MEPRHDAGRVGAAHYYHYRPLRATTGAGTCGVLLVRTGPVGAAHDDEHMCERWVEARRGADHRARDL